MYFGSENSLKEKFIQRLAHDYDPPIIIIGMHRSGTSMLTRMLRKAGGYFGKTLENNSEAIIFMTIHDELLRKFGSSWSAVNPVFDFEQRDHREKALRHIVGSRYRLWNGFFSTFGESGNECKRPSEINSNYPILNRFSLNWPRKVGSAPFWGWKDPRSTLTLSLWLELFPEARIIHTTRNGIDSALSLWERCKKSGVGAPECLNLTYCFHLWERYVNEGIRWRDKIKDRYLELRYEDLLEHPLPILKEVFEFIQVGATSIEDISTAIRSDNRDSYKKWAKYPDLIKAAGKSNTFSKLGYDSMLQRVQA